MAYTSSRRLFGTVASLAAAYAVVLNVMLSSLLLASIPPAEAAAGYQICRNSPGLAATQDDSGKATGQLAAHCPLCIGNHAPGAPPAPNLFLPLRIAIAVAPAVAPEDPSVAPTIASDHRARAPPRPS